MSLLEVRALGVRYGAVRAVEDVSLTVKEGEIVALIGANGAGKSSTLRAIVGLAPISAGSVESPTGTRISGRTTDWIASHCQFAYVPEGRGLFPQMTVHDNLEVGAYSRRGEGRMWCREAIERAFSIFPRLAERKDQQAGTLSGGEQQMLAIGRALVAEPRLLLLDEPSHGLAPKVVAEMFDRLQQINLTGTAFLLVEQNSRIALTVSARAYVMERGAVVVEGRSSDLREDDAVRRAYLGLAVA